MHLHQQRPVHWILHEREMSGCGCFPRHVHKFFNGKQGIYFNGDAENSRFITTRNYYPAVGTQVTVKLECRDRCSDHFVVLSKAGASTVWTFGKTKSDRQVKIAFNCDQLQIYNSEALPAASVTCDWKDGQGPTEATLVIESTADKVHVSVTGGACPTTRLSAPSPWAEDAKKTTGTGAGQMVVGIGASQDNPAPYTRMGHAKWSKFNSIDIKSGAVGFTEVMVFGQASDVVGASATDSVAYSLLQDASSTMPSGLRGHGSALTRHRKPRA